MSACSLVTLLVVNGVATGSAVKTVFSVWGVDVEGGTDILGDSAVVSLGSSDTVAFSSKTDFTPSAS